MPLPFFEPQVKMPTQWWNTWIDLLKKNHLASAQRHFFQQEQKVQYCALTFCGCYAFIRALGASKEAAQWVFELGDDEQKLAMLNKYIDGGFSSCFASSSLDAIQWIFTMLDQQQQIRMLNLHVSGAAIDASGYSGNINDQQGCLEVIKWALKLGQHNLHKDSLEGALADAKCAKNPEMIRCLSEALNSDVERPKDFPECTRARRDLINVKKNAPTN